MILFFTLEASGVNYKVEANKQKLATTYYWQLLLHMEDGISEIDDPNFFLADNGSINANSELNATIDALFNETQFDDNSTACRFPARKKWLEKKLHINNFPKAQCTQYNKIIKRIDPQSATLVFPAAHINSPASMFGHTFLRINSSYNSKLLSYAINYAADAGENIDEVNGVVFALKGLFGGYYGRYSLLPYYEKLREYRDTENRDIWEYDLNLTKEEVTKMVDHIWELNGTHSYYYFFTENCSYNMLWLLEIARPSTKLRDKFNLAVIPLETVHVVKESAMIIQEHFRPSKRSRLLQYETLLENRYLHLPKSIVEFKIQPKDIVLNPEIDMQQKQYILESAIDFLEYSYSRNDLEKNVYIELFYKLSKQRATLGQGNQLLVPTPTSPQESHRAVRVKTGYGIRDSEGIGFIGLRPAYHDLEDSGYGFLRGTKIEFLDVEFSYNKDERLKLEHATILAIESLSQRSEFINAFSWRTKFAFDKDYIGKNSNFLATVGAGLSWGNDLGYVYMMVDPLVYIKNTFNFGLGTSIGFFIDKYRFMSTKVELKSRIYDNGKQQYILDMSQNFRIKQNIQLQIKYNMVEKYLLNRSQNEDTLRFNINYYL